MLTFSALADPTRLHIVELLGTHGELSAGSICTHFRTTAPAISQHLRVLKKANLVRVKTQAQKRIYSLDMDGINGVEQWVAQLKQQWETPRVAPETKEAPMSNDFEFSIARTFNAPITKVWSAWTEDKQLQQWFGPKGCPVIASNLDFREGGQFHYGMQTPDGGTMWGRWTFLTITPLSELVFVVSFSDKNGTTITRNPWNKDWPLKMLSTVKLTEKNGKTELKLFGKAYEATEIEQKAFEEGAESMNQGWIGTLDQLEAYLKAK